MDPARVTELRSQSLVTLRVELVFGESKMNDSCSRVTEESMLCAHCASWLHITNMFIFVIYISY